MYCTKCGGFIPDDADKCPACNAITQKTVQSQTAGNNQGASYEQPASPVAENGKKPSGNMTTIIAIIVFVCVMLVAIFGVVAISRNKESKAEETTESFTEYNDFTQEDDGSQEDDWTEEDIVETRIETRVETRVETKYETIVETKVVTPIIPNSPNTPDAQARFTSANASSVLEDSQYGDYVASNVIDNNKATAWVEGAEGDGIGEYLTLFADVNAPVNGIKILNGYNKDADIYAKNNRVEFVRITLSTGDIYETRLEDSYNTYTTVDFDGPKNIEGMRIEILSVYPGNKYQDTCISEIIPY